MLSPADEGVLKFGQSYNAFILFVISPLDQGQKMVLSAMLSGRSRHGNLALRTKPVELNRCFRIANLSRSMGIVKRSVIATDIVKGRQTSFKRGFSCEKRLSKDCHARILAIRGLTVRIRRRR